jgi:hypothetical protein
MWGLERVKRVGDEPTRPVWRQCKVTSEKPAPSSKEIKSVEGKKAGEGLEVSPQRTPLTLSRN